MGARVKNGARTMVTLAVYIWTTDDGRVWRGPNGEVSGRVYMRPDLPGVQTVKTEFGPTQGTIDAAINDLIARSGTESQSVCDRRARLRLARLQERIAKLEAEVANDKRIMHPDSFGPDNLIEK